MSFGFPTRAIDGYDELWKSIQHAHFRNVLLFAAASNSGGQRGRAWPAGEEEVICVHSTDALGNQSLFSPTAMAEGTNLATVGEAIESAWPMHLCREDDEGAYTAVKSGTSYATPILAGIATFLLIYTRMNLPGCAHRLARKAYMVKLLQKIAEKGQRNELRDGYHFVAMDLSKENLFGKGKAYVEEIIRDILTS